MSCESTTAEDDCCFVSYNNKPEPRFETMLHALLAGWVCCVNLTELCDRVLLVYRRRSELFARLGSGNTADVSLCFSIIPAFLTGTFYFVAMLSSSLCWAEKELWYASAGKLSYGLLIAPAASAFTSIQALTISRLYAVLKDAARLRIYVRLKSVERFTFVWALLSPLAYFAAIFFVFCDSCEAKIYFAMAALFAAELMAGFLLCVYVIPLIFRAKAASSSRVLRLWWTSACALLVGFVQLGLNGYQTFFTNKPLPSYTWDLLELLKAYYLFRLMVPASLMWSNVQGGVV